ncbi:MAG: lytic transglycosylase domain-containing protein [Betaproteobacteria bacterium]
MWALVAATSGAGTVVVHRINSQATETYAEITRRPDYQVAVQSSIEIEGRAQARDNAGVAAGPVQPRPAPRPVKIYPDTPPLFLARNYVESDPSRYTRHIKLAARATKVPAALIRAVITAESAFNPYALSSTGAVGLMQLMPDTAARYGVKNRMDPSQNILGGARYLSDLMRLFNNNMRLTIAAYNAGEGAVLKYGRKIPPYPETVAYVPKVLMYYKRYRLA